MFRPMVIRLLRTNGVPCNVMRNRKLIATFVKVCPENFAFQIIYLVMKENFKRDGYRYCPYKLTFFLFEWFRSCCCESSNFRNDPGSDLFAVGPTRSGPKKACAYCIEFHIIINTVILG